mmetsp:Transcript_7884/g.9043  ORF Transcript_7884/g.9043 Transcript_7884/m.9043 type:complete len:97 (-) Transcript_7884:82-372(-)
MFALVTHQVYVWACPFSQPLLPGFPSIIDALMQKESKACTVASVQLLTLTKWKSFDATEPIPRLWFIEQQQVLYCSENGKQHSTFVYIFQIETKTP